MGAKKQQPEKAQIPPNEREPSSVRAGGYVRVSQERNFRNGYGLDAQVTDVKRYVEYRRWQLIEIYREEGLSGFLPASSLKSSENGNKGNRPALDRLLSDARAGKFDVVVFPSIDRAARSVWNMIEIDEAFREMNVAVVFVREGIDTSDAMGQFFRNICASIAQFEGNMIHERLVKGRQAKAAQGGYCGGFAPYGYKVENGKFVVIPEEAEVVRQIFQWRIEGRSFRWIRDQLVERDVKTRKGGQWHFSTVQSIIRQPLYAGFRRYAGGYCPADHEAIVSVETFNQAQQVFMDAADRKLHASKRIRLPALPERSAEQEGPSPRNSGRQT